MPERSVLFIHAHPDDEALWSGGALAVAHAAGHRTTVVTCTWEPGTVRAHELHSSCALLGTGTPLLLGYQDAFKPESAPHRPRLLDLPTDTLVGDLVKVIREVKPDAVVTYDAFGIYGHPDHIATHRATIIAVEAAAQSQMYPDAGPAWQTSTLYLSTVTKSFIDRVWSAYEENEPFAPTRPGTPDADVSLSVDVRDVCDLKWRAVCEHRTEMADSRTLKLIAALNDSDRRYVLGTESYRIRRLAAGTVDIW